MPEVDDSHDIGTHIHHEVDEVGALENRLPDYVAKPVSCVLINRVTRHLTHFLDGRAQPAFPRQRIANRIRRDVVREHSAMCIAPLAQAPVEHCRGEDQGKHDHCNCRCVSHVEPFKRVPVDIEA